MTSSNIDPATGRAISGDDRDSIDLGGPGDPSYDPASGGNSYDYAPRESFEPETGSPDFVTHSSSDSSSDPSGGGVGEKAKQVAGQVGDQAAAVKETVSEQTAAVKDSVTEGAVQVKDVAVERAGDVAGVAKDELTKLASDARSQVQTLWSQAAGQLREQAGAGQHQLADLVHGLAGELGELASKAESDGPVTSLLKQAAYHGGQFSHWLSEADTADVLTELRRFARKRPVLFLAGATVAGVVVGRLSRGLMAAAKTEQESAPSGPGAEGHGVTPVSTGVVTVPPVSYAEVPDFNTEPTSTIDTGFPGQLSGDTGGYQR